VDGNDSKKIQVKQQGQVQVATPKLTVTLTAFNKKAQPKKESISLTAFT